MQGNHNILQIRRPLVGIAVSIVVGLGVGAMEVFSLKALLLIAFLFLLLACFHFRSAKSSVFLFGTIICLAACRYNIAVCGLIEKNQLPFNLTLPAEQVELIGEVADAPQFYAYRTGGLLSFPLSCEQIEFDGKQANFLGTVKVRVRVDASYQPIQQGSRLRIQGALAQSYYPNSFGRLELEADKKGWSLLSDPNPNSPRLWLQGLRERSSRILGREMESRTDELSIANALLLGYRKAVSAEVYDLFRRTGTLHIFAISGLHVGIVGMLLIVLLKTIGISRLWWGVWLCPILFLYVMSTGMKSSALRALAMAAIYFVAPLFYRRPDVASSVSLAAIGLLMIQPLEIFSIGFIFSFAVVGFIIMLFSVVPAEGFYAPAASFQLTGSNRFLHALRTLRGYVLTLLITSLAAFIAAVPLAALLFGTFTPVVLISNLVAVPLTFLVVLTGWLSILTGIVSPYLSIIFNHANAVIISILLWAMQLLAHFPGGHFKIQPPPLAAVIFWFVGWILFFTHARTKRARIGALCLVVTAFGWGVLVQF